MTRASSCVLSRALLHSVFVVLACCVLSVMAAEANVKVNCNIVGQTITQALIDNATVSPLVLVVRGPCVENVVIARDDVTIKTNGVVAASISALDLGLAVIALDGAHRIRIDGLAPGISISGGVYGVAATRGATARLANCDVSSASNSAAIASFGSTLEIDSCDLHDNNRGGVASNESSLIVTNSTSENNQNEGILAVRSSYVRVGQNRNGDTVAQPVTVNHNLTHGISVLDSSSATIVATNIQNHVNGNGISIQRSSAATIGTGTNGFVSPNTIQGSGVWGVSVYQASSALIQGNTITSNSRGVGVNETASATIIGNNIQNNTARGVQVGEKSSAKIGVNDGANATSANTISNNGSDGIGIFDGGEGVVAGNTISSNGGNGISMNMGTMNLVGGNTISANASHGIFVGASRLFQGPGTFGTLPDTADVSQNNGLAGLFLFNNSSADLYRITLSGNAREGIGASLNSTINLHVYDAARPNNFISVTGNGTANVPNQNDGITLFSASMLASPQKPNPGDQGQIIITGQPGWGVNCFGNTTKAAVGMDTTGISGNAAGTVNCGGF